MIEPLGVTQTGTHERKDAQANVKDVLCCVNSPCIANEYMSDDGDGLLQTDQRSLPGWLKRLKVTIYCNLVE